MAATGTAAVSAEVQPLRPTSKKSARKAAVKRPATIKKEK